jgi:TusE/DsrC/DsvC family sulfur relay protein
MSAMQVAGRELELNPKGHLVHFHHWDREVAQALAADEGLSLTDCHWTVIDFLRGYYATYDHPPSPRLVVKGVGAKLTLNAPCTRKTLEALFPDGGCKQACRIAGLPDYYCHAL